MSYRSTALTALTLAGSMALVVGPATADPTTTGSPTADDIEVICDGIGEDTVTVTGDLASGGDAEITSGPLSVVGTPGFTGTDNSGDSVTVAPTGDGAVCTAQEETKGADLDEVLPSAQAAKDDASGTVTGRLTFTVEVDMSALPPATGSRMGTTAKLPFESEVRSYLNSRPGAVGVAVRMPGTGKSWTYTKTASRNVTASIVKVQIMSGVMMKAQREGRALSSWERSKIRPMIRNSNNSATTALFNHIGGRSGLQQVGDRLGMTQTTADPAGHWGLTVTTAHDQAKLMEHYARPSSRLSYTNRVYGLQQMRRVASSQDWGVSAGPPQGAVALKNGWLPRTDGWHVNSIGWQNHGSADYTIGVLTHHDPGSMNTQINTIEGVSRIVWRNRFDLVDSSPPASRGVRGDFDGDGRADLMGTSASGRVYVMKSSGGGQFGAKQVIKSGLSDANWFGTAGDVNEDGRADVLVRRGDGRLQLMYSLSNGKLGPLKTIMTGWSSVTDISAGGDVDGDGTLDVVIRKTGGSAHQYDLSDDGRLTRGRAMGTPFRWYPTIRLVGDVNGDGRDDLRGVASGGRMRTWTSTGSSWRQTSATSTGWDAYRSLAVPGDVNGTSSRQDDPVGVNPAGTGHLYLGTSGGGLSNGHHTLDEYLGNLPYVF